VDVGIQPTSVLAGMDWPTPAADSVRHLGLDVLLQGLQLAATDKDREAAADPAKQGWDADTPPSMQVIKSGALAITKSGTKWVKNAGGIAAALAALAGVISPFVAKLGAPVAIAFIASAALILSSAAIALSLFVKGDLEARGMATAARHQGRADVAAAFLAATASMPARGPAPSGTTTGRTVTEDFLVALAAFPNRLKVTTENNPDPVRVLSMWRNPDKEFWLSIGDEGTQDRIRLEQITGFTTAAS
jgi:hypothetical protein